MKNRIVVLGLGLLALSGLATMNASAGTGVFVGVEIHQDRDFYEPLGQYGHWVDVAPYGQCWYPAYVSSSWQPYANGYWLWTDGGWYWVSDEQWAWACYHYGRWAYDSYYGWLWIPETEWAPAWVSWREGDGYIGWAPLPPRCGFGSRGVITADAVVIAPRAYVFVESRRFCEPIRPAIIVHRTDVDRMVNITNIRRVNNVILNDGPDTRTIRELSHRDVPTAKIQELRYPRGAQPVRGESHRPVVIRGSETRTTSADNIPRPWPIRPTPSERDPTLQPPRGVRVIGAPRQWSPNPENHAERTPEAPARMVNQRAEPPALTPTKRFRETAPPSAAGENRGREHNPRKYGDDQN